MREYGAKGAVGVIAFTMVVFGVVFAAKSTAVSTWLGTQPSDAPVDDLVDQLLLGLVVVGGVALAASAFVMRLLKGGDDDPIDYDRL